MIRFTVFSMVLLTLSAASFADDWDSPEGPVDPYKVATIHDLPFSWVTDGICVPNHGIHYKDMFASFYGEPLIGFDTKGRVMFFEYLFPMDEMDALMDFHSLPGVGPKSVHHLDFEARPDGMNIPPELRPFLCDMVPEDMNMCRPHYALHVFFADQQKLESACDGAELPFPNQDRQFDKR